MAVSSSVVHIYMVNNMLLIFIFFLVSLSGCPIAAAEKLSKGHDKPQLSQPGGESFKGCPNDRVLRWEIQKQYMCCLYFITFDKYKASRGKKCSKRLIR